MSIPQSTIPPLTPVIAGPTAGGKSDLAVELALALRDRFSIPAEIVTADAFQVYTGLDIGTAKPTPAERRGIPHHLIDIVPSGPGVPPGLSPNAPFTLDDWLRRATATIAHLRARGILPIVVGGTHLYIKALLDGLFQGPEPDPVLRAELAAMAPAVRRAELERIDPASAARIHPNDIRRTIRALEVYRLTGQPISAHQQQWDKNSPAHREGAGGRAAVPPPDHIAAPRGAFLLVILDWDTDALNRRINARVKDMIDRGLIDEVRALDAAGAFTPQSAEALGYKQLLPLIRAPRPPAPAALEAAIEQIKIETRRFAKNQRTWLRRLRTTPGAMAFSCPDATPAHAAAAILARLFPEPKQKPPISDQSIPT